MLSVDKPNIRRIIHYVSGSPRVGERDSLRMRCDLCMPSCGVH